MYCLPRFPSANDLISSAGKDIGYFIHWKGIFTSNVKENCFVGTDKNKISPELCTKIEDQSLHRPLLFPMERVNRNTTLKSRL